MNEPNYTIVTIKLRGNDINTDFAVKLPGHFGCGMELILSYDPEVYMLVECERIIEKNHE